MVCSSSSKSWRRREPVVDDEEHVAEAVAGDLAAGPHPPVRRRSTRCRARRIRVSRGSSRPADLGDRAPHAVAVQPGRDAADVRQRCQRGQRAAAEVEAVELDLLRRVHQRERGDQGPQHRRLAAARRADDADVARGAGKVQPHRVAPLLERPVDDPGDRAAACRAMPGPSAVQPRCGVVESGRQQLVERRRLVERRQPDLVRRRAHARRAARRRRRTALLDLVLGEPWLRLVLGELRPDVLGAERHDLRPQPALLRAGRPGSTAGPETYAALNRVIASVPIFR